MRILVHPELVEKMKNLSPKEIICLICGKPKARSQMMAAALVRGTIAEEIRKQYPEWATDGYICLEDLNHFRSRYIQSLLESEKGELTSLEDEVLNSLKQHEILASNIDAEFDKELSFAERLSDKTAEFGGSWKFLMAFGCTLIGWIALNSFVVLRKPFDPYPFILLNLVLSCLAAIQAPIIMMSQNRQDAKDRLRSEHDYRVNLKAELEIRHLHEKIDHLLSRQWERLVEIQQIQIELLTEMTGIRQKRG
jgi:uncharacterized membrane protein